MILNFKNKLHWLIISILILGSFFVCSYLFSISGGYLNFSIGSNYNTVTVNGESIVQTDNPDISNVAPEVNAARTEAFKNATAISAELSRLSGLQLSKVTSISEYLDRYPFAPVDSETMPKQASNEGALKMTVTITYQIK